MEHLLCYLSLLPTLQSAVGGYVHLIDTGLLHKKIEGSKAGMGSISSFYFFFYCNTAPSPREELMSNVNLTVMPGDRVGLVGQNGAGKSTLLQCIAGYRPMDEGTCTVKTGARVGEKRREASRGCAPWC